MAQQNQRAFERQESLGNTFVKPSNSQLQKEGQQLQEFINKHGRPPAYRVKDQGDTEYSKWPVELHSTDPQDKKFALREKIIGQAQQNNLVPQVPGQGVAVVSDDYWDYISRKEDQAFLADFKAFLYSSMKLDSPEAMAYWKSQVPEVFEDRMKLFDQQLELVKKQAKINMLGPQSLEDWYFIYLVKKGMIQLPSGRLELGESHPTDTFSRGLFNLRRWWPSQIRNPTPLLDWNAPLEDRTNQAPIIGAQPLRDIFGSGARDVSIGPRGNPFLGGPGILPGAANISNYS
jgi:hypothetical protein